MRRVFTYDQDPNINPESHKKEVELANKKDREAEIARNKARKRVR